MYSFELENYEWNWGLKRFETGCPTYLYIYICLKIRGPLVDSIQDFEDSDVLNKFWIPCSHVWHLEISTSVTAQLLGHDKMGARTRVRAKINILSFILSHQYQLGMLVCVLQQKKNSRTVWSVTLGPGVTD